MSEQSNVVVDRLTEQLRASTVQDGASSDDWKSKLNLPARDNRHQTEVCLLSRTIHLDLSVCMHALK